MKSITIQLEVNGEIKKTTIKHNDPNIALDRAILKFAKKGDSVKVDYIETIH